MTAVPAALMDKAVPLASRHGLLLVRLKRVDLEPGIIQLAVCNLLAGVCHMLPPLDFRSAFDASWVRANFHSSFYRCDWNGYAILTSTDCTSGDDDDSRSTSSFFQVVSISIYSKGINCSFLHTFSSNEASWRVRTDWSFGIRPDKFMSSVDAVVRRCTVHWVFRYDEEVCLHTINLNTRTGHISLTKLPFLMNRGRYNDICLTLAVNGALSVLWMQTEGTQLDIWEEQEEDQLNVDASSEWKCARTIKLKEHGMKENDATQLYVVAEKSGILLLRDKYQIVYTANLETGMMEEVVDWPHGYYIHHKDTVLFEIDWPAIFSSHT
jgi:hypothetical protein